MRLQQFFVEKIAHSSYILAGKKQCAVIDPQRDVDGYIRAARSMGTAITHILQTHLHADFISGHIDLAKKTGAKIYVAASAACEFEHVGLREGDSFQIEHIRVKVIETPGHTPEHLSYIVEDTSRATEPVGVFVGDTLFVGDVGRPDLFPRKARELASLLFHSLHRKLLALPDHIEVFPAHGAGSLCGRAMGARRRTTIGYERRFNASLQIADREEFIRSLTEGMPPAPDHFSRCSEVNRRGPTRVADLPPLEELTPGRFRRALRSSAPMVLDTRSYPAFGGAHIPGSLHLDLRGNFPTFAGWMIPPEQPVLLVARDHDQALEAVSWARRAGVDGITGYLDGGMAAWAAAGHPATGIPQITADSLHRMLSGNEPITLLDVRAPLEFQDNHIQGAVNIPVADLRSRHNELPKDAALVLMCSSGNRSSLGCSLLLQKGFRNVINLAGGMSGYSAAGFTAECRACENPHGSRFFTSVVEAVDDRDPE